ncbi:YkgJ family cysteine cluster protein [Candidatus Hodarchaeum mangrovi]
MNFIETIHGRFKCQQSGHCCTSSKILVTLTYLDIFNLFVYLDSDFEQLLRKITFYKVKQNYNSNFIKQLVLSPVNTSDGIILPGLKKLDNEVCIFYHKPSCSIYSRRPLACQNYPFAFIEEEDFILSIWAKNAEKTCPGIGKGNKINKSSLQKSALTYHRIIGEHNRVVENINIEAETGRALTARESLLILLTYAQKSNNSPPS